MPNTKKVLCVVGGGAAGFFCAIQAATLQENLRVTILEKTGKILQKVKISGGGRCNVTHACFEIPALSKKYPRGENFLKKSLHWFSPKDTIQWFADRGVTIVEEADGRMFPSTNQSQTIIDCLMREVNRLQIEIRYHAGVQSIQKNEYFQLSLQSGEQLSADYVCIAVGGYPSLQQFDWLQSLGHTIVPPVPSLFTFNLPKHPITSLMGVSVPNVLVKVNGTSIKQEGPILITHWGLSGPAVLKASAWGATELAALKYQFTANINWLHAFNFNEQDVRAQWNDQRSKFSTQKIAAKSMFNLPIRLWQFLVASAGIQDHQNWSTLQSEQQKLLTKYLLAYEVQVSGKTTFKEEFVTAGGISLSEVDVNTMQSKKIEGLYFAGEILNVDGVTGGFNFQHAWTSGWIAAKSIAHSLKDVSVQS